MMMVQKPQSGTELDGYSTKTDSTRLMMTAPHLSGQWWWWWWWYCEMQQKCRYCYCLPKTVSELSIENRTGVDEATVCCKSNNPPHGRSISSPWTDTSSLQHTHTPCDRWIIFLFWLFAVAAMRYSEKKERNNETTKKYSPKNL
jgi:hypothetical protein